MLLQGRHVLVLLLKLCITLIEALKNLTLLLHVALLIKETLESLVGFLLPLLILLEWILTLITEKKKTFTNDQRRENAYKHEQVTVYKAAATAATITSAGY